MSGIMGMLGDAVSGIESVFGGGGSSGGSNFLGELMNAIEGNNSSSQNSQGNEMGQVMSDVMPALMMFL